VANTSEAGLAAGGAILDRLVTFDTTSTRSNLELIDWVADYFGRYGIATARSSSGDSGQPVRDDRVGGARRP
jgi:acetylornithine deacetylase